MPLIQVTSGGQRSLLKKKLQVCESQQSCLFVGDQILIFHHNLQINSLKILQCDFLDLFSYFVSHSWGIPMMKITGLSHLFKWENLHNWWLTKYFFAPLYVICCFICSSWMGSNLVFLLSFCKNFLNIRRINKMNHIRMQKLTFECCACVRQLYQRRTRYDGDVSVVVF